MKRRALLLPRRDDGLLELAHNLLNVGLELVVSDLAGRVIAAAGLPVMPLDFATRQSKLLGGRGSSLHQSFHLGIAANLDSDRERNALDNARVPAVDVVVAQLPQLVEDLGDDPVAGLGRSDAPAVVALVQLAAANFGRVVVLTDPSDYSLVPAALTRTDEGLAMRRTLASRALAAVAAFVELQLSFVDLDRPAEPEPSEGAAPVAEPVDLSVPAGGMMVALAPADSVPGTAHWTLYEDSASALTAQGSFDLLHGEPPDKAALLDMDAAMSALADLPAHPSCAVAARGHVCSVASSVDSSMRAMLRAIGADPAAARGGALAFNGRVDATLARALVDFEHAKGLRLLMAEAFDDEAAVMLGAEADRTLIEVPRDRRGGVRGTVRPTRYGVLFEAASAAIPELAQAKPLGATQPAPQLLAAADLAFRTARHLASAALVICDSTGTLGVAGGQAHISDAVQIGAAKARRANRACAAVASRPIEHPAAVAALARAQVKILVLPAAPRNPGVIDAADGAGMAVLHVASGWRTLR